MNPSSPQLKSLLTNARVDQRLSGLQPNLMVASNGVSGVIGLIWDGVSPLKAQKVTVSSQNLMWLIRQLNGSLNGLGDIGVPPRSHSDIRLVRYQDGHVCLVVDISVDGVLLPIQTPDLIDEPLSDFKSISDFIIDIHRCLQVVCKFRKSYAWRDHIMADCMASFAVSSGNPALAIWLRLSPICAKYFHMHRFGVHSYDFYIQTLDEKLEPGVVFGRAFSATQMQGLIELYLELEQKLRQRKLWLIANNAIAALDSLTAVLLNYHNLNVQLAYQRCFDEHKQTGKPLVIYKTDTTQHSIFFEDGTLRCNVISDDVSITGRIVSVPIQLPDTMVLTAPGRLIGQLIDHSVFAASQAKIINAELSYEGTSFELELHDEFIRA